MKIVIGGDGPGPAVQAYLDGLSRSELHELVLTLAECSETVRRTLEAVAELAGERRGGAGEDPVRRAAALLSAPKGYEDYESYDFEYGEYTDNGYAADILDFLDELEALIDDGGADAAAPPLRMIIVRLRPDLYEGRGDTGGLMERAGDRAAELYARACREGRPDVGALAAWLAQFRLEGLSCPELALTDFLPALGEEGLAVYRGAVEAAPPSRQRFVLEVELADADGDVDRAVELLAEETTGPWYASIVERLLAAGRRGGGTRRWPGSTAPSPPRAWGGVSGTGRRTRTSSEGAWTRRGRSTCTSGPDGPTTPWSWRTGCSGRTPARTPTTCSWTSRSAWAAGTGSARRRWRGSTGTTGATRTSPSPWRCTRATSSAPGGPPTGGAPTTPGKGWPTPRPSPGPRTRCACTRRR